MGKSVPAQYFIDLYRREADPWQFESSAYERAKYGATLEALPRRRYRNALEIACSIGVFTRMLAERCDALLAIDVSPDALERARRSCASHTNVRFERREVPRGFPAGTFDLITVCEVGFYLDADDLRTLCATIMSHTADGGHVILVHWTPRVDGHASTAEQVHDAFRAVPELHRIHGYSAQTYRLDVLERGRHA